MYICGGCVRTETAERERIYMGLSTDPDGEEMSAVNDVQARSHPAVTAAGSDGSAVGFTVVKPSSVGAGHSPRSPVHSRVTSYANARHPRMDSTEINRVYSSIQLH